MKTVTAEAIDQRELHKKRRSGAMLGRALESDFLPYFKGAETNKMFSQAQL